MILEGRPLTGGELQRLKAFLERQCLDYESGIEYTVCLLDDATLEIIGTGSVEHNVLKCVAIDPPRRGEGLAGTILSHLIEYEFEAGRPHLFLFTKPENHGMFEDLGFYPILQTPEILLMENRKNGISSYLEELKYETPFEALEARKRIGTVVVNCNPFTLGHRYLMETAAADCDFLHVFVLSDNRSAIPAEDRYRLVREGISGIPNIILHRTSDYLVSAATFPTYFIKEKATADQANCSLDLELFGRRIAPPLHITCRYVGTEPICRVTNSYNQAMKKILPELGIQVREIERIQVEGQPVSASVVRALAAKGELRQLKKLVPESTYRYLQNEIRRVEMRVNY